MPSGRCRPGGARHKLRQTPDPQGGYHTQHYGVDHDGHHAAGVKGPLLSVEVDADVEAAGAAVGRRAGRNMLCAMVSALAALR